MKNLEQETFDYNGYSLLRLREEENLFKYIALVNVFSKRYTVIIVSYDTPYGPGYKPELSRRIMQLGLHTDLYGKFRASYVAVIDEGKTFFEKNS